MAIINSRPLSVDTLNDPNTPSPLMPNHLLTIKMKVVLPSPSSFQSADLYGRKCWRRVQHLANEFWSRWRKEFLLSLQPDQKWLEPHRNLCVGDILIIRDKHLPCNKWQLARVSSVNPSTDGPVCTVQLAFAETARDSKGRIVSEEWFLERTVHKLVLLMSRQEQEGR